MVHPVTWVSPRHVDLHTNSRGAYYAFYAVDSSFKRYRVFSDEKFRPRLIHFLAAIEAGVEIWMPILPKANSEVWHIALDHVDDTPPPAAAEKDKRPVQLSFETPRRIFSSMADTKKQTFVITEDYSAKATQMAKRLQFARKSDFLANVVANQMDLYDKMDAIC